MNDPDPPPERIEQVLGRYPFGDVPAAYENLMALATEKIRFLSTRRCRHFLAAIAPRLLGGDRRDARAGYDAREPQPRERFARRQGGAVGAVQLQPAVAEFVRRAVRRLPVSWPASSPATRA